MRDRTDADVGEHWTGETPGDDDVVAPAPSLETIFDLLANRRRRYLLYCLRHADDCALSFERLVDDVAMLEARAESKPVTADLRASITQSLRHTHLPKVAATPVVEHDERSGVVRFRRQPTLEEYLDHTAYKEFDSQW